MVGLLRGLVPVLNRQVSKANEGSAERGRAHPASCKEAGEHAAPKEALADILSRVPFTLYIQTTLTCFPHMLALL